MDYDFSKITPEQFEQFCYHLLSEIGFTNLEWYGRGGGDRGLDIVGTKTLEPLPGQRREEQWVVQCERYIQARLQKSELSTTFTFAREHHPDSLLLIAAAGISTNAGHVKSSGFAHFPRLIRTYCLVETNDGEIFHA